jgi:hypothetical protein
MLVQGPHLTAEVWLFPVGLDADMSQLQTTVEDF